MGAVVNRTHTHEDPPPCARYPSAVGSPMRPLASPATTALSRSRPSRPVAAASPSTTMPTRSWPLCRSNTAAAPTREQLIRENAALRQENAELWEWLYQTIEFPLLKQQQFAVTAFAMGLSLSQIVVLLAMLLGTRVTPSRSRIHRWIQAAARAAGSGPQAAGPRGQDLGPGRLSRRDLLPPQTGPGGGRAPEHDVVSGEEGRQPPRSDLVCRIAVLVLVGLCDLRRRPGAQGGNRPDATAPTPGPPSPFGEGARCLPHQAGRPAAP